MSEYSTGLGLLYEILREKGYDYQLKELEIFDGGLKNTDKFKLFLNNTKINISDWNEREKRVLNEAKTLLSI